MLLVVGWSSLVVWLNVRPRISYMTLDGESCDPYWIDYGCPWTYAFRANLDQSNTFRWGPMMDGAQIGLEKAALCDNGAWLLAANIAIGLLAVLVLTFASKYLVRAIVAGLRAFVGKPPPDKEEGPSKSN